MAAGRHALVAIGFAALAVLISWPLAADLDTVVPGRGPGDNLTFVWNFWWMRQALATGANPFETAYLFHPFGTSLVLNTHTALNAFLGATVLAPLSIVTAQNVVILTALTLNGFCTYLLVWRLTTHRAGAVLAGLFFAMSPYVAAHLHGHFNLIGAWPLPAFALLWMEAVEKRSLRRAGAAGLLLVATAYSSYYYLVFLGGFIVCVLAARWVRAQVVVSKDPPTPGRRRIGRAAAIAGLVLAAAAVGIAVTGGGVVTIGGVRVSATTGTNVRTGAWLMAMVAAWARWRPRVRLAWSPSASPRADVRVVATTAAIALVGILPLVVGGWQLWARGEYASQQYRWRNAPAGIDAASLVVPSPSHPLWGSAAEQVYAAWDLDLVENTAWPGLVAPVVLLLTRRSWWANRDLRPWLVVGGAFFLWSLGPYLMVAGGNTGLHLPQTLLRFVPVVSNARIPARAMVMVYLAIAVVLGRAIASSRLGDRRVALVLGGLIVCDFLPAPFPVYALPQPAIYADLAARPAGGVLEVPFGIRDGFGETGSLDHRTLYYQSLHRKPLVGGFVARMSPPLARRFEATPLLDVLLRLSGGEAVDDTRLALARATAWSFLTESRIRYLVVDVARTTPALRALVDTLPVTLASTADGRQLYVVDERPR